MARRRASAISNHEAQPSELNLVSRSRPSFETRAMRAPQDEDFFRGLPFLATLVLAVLGAAFAAFFAALRAFGRLFCAARWAAASAALAHVLNSSVSSNSRAGNCQ